MTHVATLISDPARPALDAALIARVRGALPDAGDVRVLADGIAADIVFKAPGGQDNHTDNRARTDALRPLLGNAPLDIVVQATERRRKRLFLADMDSTMIGQECIDELADFVSLKAHVSAITERAMRGEIAFEPALRERVALLKGLPAAIVDDVIRERITLTPGGRTLVATMRAHGAYACLVSGGFTVFTNCVGAMIGFDEDRSNILLIDEEARLTGLVAEPILGREAKLATLVDLRKKLGLAKDETLATGDGANDLAMIEDAGLGVAFHAKPQVAAAAHARIDYGDLTALLYVQGYARSEFKEG
jgi:phosphoserine phosphatase